MLAIPFVVITTLSGLQGFDMTQERYGALAIAAPQRARIWRSIARSTSRSVFALFYLLAESRKVIARRDGTMALGYSISDRRLFPGSAMPAASPTIPRARCRKVR